jgi:Prenyltransferase and squalene oxidase repeat
MTPKPLSDAVNKGLVYLAGRQDAGGGWSQGGGWRTNPQGGRVEGPDVQDPPDLANTCAATLALLRAGHTPRQGDYAAHAGRALDFVVASVERSDDESPYVTDLRGTQVQTKIGPLADTFLASLALSEARGGMADEAGEVRLSAALDKVIAKLERHQQEDGTWAMNGWAPVVGQALGAAGLNRARQRGSRVADETLERAERYARAQYDGRTKSYAMGGSAGVPLYGTASHMSAASHSVYSFKALKPELHKMATDAASPKDRQDRAAAKLKYIEEAEAAQEESLSAHYAHFKDERFRQGFGSNGGEEFLSYLNISETLALKGGPEWQDWDRSMTENLERIQNGDGSWSGHHCITGRTFCTAAALLVLMADRAPRPETATL